MKKPKFGYQSEPLPVLAMNWKAPDYAAIFGVRLQNLEKIRADPAILPGQE